VLDYLSKTEISAEEFGIKLIEITSNYDDLFVFSFEQSAETAVACS